jgi:predicted transcriptional regulator of viral defense system
MRDKGAGIMKYLAKLRERFKDEPAFTLRDIRLFLKGSGIKEAYLKVLVHHLVRKSEIRRITSGTYSFSQDISCVGFAFAPYYYGLQDALSIHGLWEQGTSPVVLTPRRVRTGLRNFDGGNFSVRHIDPRMFFGFESTRSGGMWVNVSTVEKTLIDFAHFNLYLGRGTLKEAARKTDWKKMGQYLRRCPDRTRKAAKKMLGVAGRVRPQKKMR